MKDNKKKRFKPDYSWRITDKEIDNILADKECKKLSRKDLEGYYLSAIANWNVTISDRNRWATKYLNLKKKMNLQKKVQLVKPDLGG